MDKIPKVEDFFEQHIQRGVNNTHSKYLEVAKEFAKLHVKAALEAASKKSEITRKPTGEGQSSEEKTRPSFEGDLGNEIDWIPVEYTVNEQSILNAYPETNIV